MAKPANDKEILLALIGGKRVYCTPELLKPILSACASMDRSPSRFKGQLIVVQGVFIED